MQAIEHFLMNSDYPFDMITYYATYEFTEDSSNDRTMSFNHNLPYTPLLFGTWSNKSDGSGYTGPLAPTGSLYQLFVYSDDTKVYVHRHTGNPSQTVGQKRYLKIYGFAPTTWTGDCAPTAQSSSDFILDTDKSYAPLLASGVIMPSIRGAGQANTNYVYTIGKDGYIEIPIDSQQMSMNFYHSPTIMPNVMLWLENGSGYQGKIIQSSQARFMSTGYPNGSYYPFTLYTSVGGGLVTVNVGTRGASDNLYKVHARIYG